MKRTLFRLACASAACLPLLAFGATIEVHVTGVVPGKGKINVAVCDQAHFLKDCAYSNSVPANSTEAKLTFTGIPAGAWAILAYQDENENDVLDRFMGVIPKENYGFSRDARGKFSAPSFDDAAITVPEGGAPTIAAFRLH